MEQETTHQPAKPGRELVTFAVFAFNQEHFIREAIKGAFAQSYSPLEIILTDDCSTDRTFEIMMEMAEAYQGPHSIKLNRNGTNLGLINHVNKIFQLARGELIVAAAGDDISLPTRASQLADAYEASERRALLLHSSVAKIDENGNDLGVWQPPIITETMDLRRIALSSALYIGASGAWSKQLYNFFGPLQFKSAYEDLTLGFRAALFNSIVYIKEPLVNYRVESGISKRGRNLFKEHERINLMFIDVLQQRIKDLCQLGNDADTNTLQLLTEELSIQRIRSLTYKSPTQMISAFKNNRLTTLKAVVRELKFLASFLKTNLFFYLQSMLSKSKPRASI